jgi:hypothetical protein
MELNDVNIHTMRNNTMKKLNITKEQFNRSRYFKNKYGELEYVSESGNVFKTNKGKVLKFKESKKFGKKFNERTNMDPKEAEKQLRVIGDNDPDSIIWILGDILRGIADNCTEDVADSILGSVQEPKLAQLTMAIYQNISNGRL